MHVAVAGAAGFIGRAAVRALRAAGHDVAELARGGAVPRADALVWAAGKREATFDANRAVHVDAAVATLRASGATRVVYLSSGECYGDVPLPYRENGPVAGTSDYARAKLEGEKAVRSVTEGCALRLGVVYGPGQAPTMMIPQLVAALRAGIPFALTEGTQTRDFVFVEDVARAIVLAVEHDRLPPVINIGSGHEIAVRDAVREIARALGAPESLLQFGAIAMRPDEARRYVLNVERAAAILGWHATTTLAEGASRL